MYYLAFIFHSLLNNCAKLIKILQKNTTKRKSFVVFAMFFVNSNGLQQKIVDFENKIVNLVSPSASLNLIFGTPNHPSDV